MKIEIYRFGHYINEVRTKSELHEWLLNNLPYSKGDMVVPKSMTFEDCINYAKKKDFTFKSVSEWKTNK